MSRVYFFEHHKLSWYYFNALPTYHLFFQHDWPQECRPGGVRGNYIMFASATSGDRDNNNQFSHCSKSNISAVLDAITESRYGYFGKFRINHKRKTLEDSIFLSPSNKKFFRVFNCVFLPQPLNVRIHYYPE